VVAVLRALEVPVDSPDGAADALRHVRHRQATRRIEPVVVHRPGARCDVTICIDARTEPDEVWIGLRLEDGSVEHRRLGSLPVARTASVEAEGVCGVARTVALDDLEPVPGYHRVELEGPRTEASALLIAAPRACPRPARGWGVWAPLHAVRRPGDWGTGTYRDLARLAAWVASRGGACVGTLPLFAAFAQEPWADASPYRPVSRLMWNELFLDVESLPELSASPEARAELRSLTDVGSLESLRRSRLTDPAGTMSAKRRVLRHLVHALCEAPSARRDEFDAFVRDRPELVTYARFRAACERLGRPWTEWHPSSPGRLPPGDDDRGAVHTHLYAQWACEGQLADSARHGAGLYLDVPVGVHPAGFDPWRWPGLFAASASGGAPPDTFSPSGQDWGFPPLHPERIREDGYRYIVDGWRHCLRHATVVRIDHIAGLHRLYWIPHGFDPSQGVYVRYRGEELHAALVLEADRAGAAVVGEDLGTVPTAVRRAMARDGILSSWVLQFASRPDDPFPSAPRSSMASFGTHDLPTLDAFWRGADIDDRLARGVLGTTAAEGERARRAAWRTAVLEAPLNGCPPTHRSASTSPLASAPPPRAEGPNTPDGSGHQRAGGDTDADPGDADVDPGDAAVEHAALSRVLGHMALGRAELVLVDMEDLWLEPEPQNRPGTSGDAANFRRRWRCTLEQAEEDSHVVGLTGIVDHLRRGGAE
jgi:4-alpha-glucanotransferase